MINFKKEKEILNKNENDYKSRKEAEKFKYLNFKDEFKLNLSRKRNKNDDLNTLLNESLTIENEIDYKLINCQIVDDETLQFILIFKEMIYYKFEFKSLKLDELNSIFIMKKIHNFCFVIKSLRSYRLRIEPESRIKNTLNAIESAPEDENNFNIQLILNEHNFDIKVDTLKNFLNKIVTFFE
jgi:hypothetical protein